MKFYIKHIILWLKNGNKRTLDFENNKVNIITGKQSTGKSTIIEIIDYCFFASQKNMPEGEIIDKNVEWYGINFVINDKVFTIARHQEIKLNQYYFSSNGNIPESPFINMPEKNIQNKIDKEFSIDSNFIFSNKEKQSISARHFMMFNTQKRDTLSNKNNLFDNTYESKNFFVKELNKIFYLALGISSMENLIKIDFHDEEQIKLKGLKNKLDNSNRSSFNMDENLIKFCEEAQKLEIINTINSDEECLSQLEQLIEGLDKIDKDEENLFKEQLSLKLKINQFEKYESQYQKYKSVLDKDSDSLKPIEYLKNNFTELLNDELLDKVIDNLDNELKAIQNHIKLQDSTAINELHDKIHSFKKQLININI
jgi:hypothetical protein